MNVTFDTPSGTETPPVNSRNLYVWLLWMVPENFVRDPGKPGALRKPVVDAFGKPAGGTIGGPLGADALVVGGVVRTVGPAVGTADPLGSALGPADADWPVSGSAPVPDVGSTFPASWAVLPRIGLRPVPIMTPVTARTAITVIDAPMMARRRNLRMSDDSGSRS